MDPEIQEEAAGSRAQQVLELERKRWIIL